MAATLTYNIYTGETTSIASAGSGLGFYGSSFGDAVAVGSYQDTTYLTDANGLTQGAAAPNVKWTHANSGEVAGTTNLPITGIPNYQATVNVRFTYDSAVQARNVTVRTYDRTSTANPPSGVTCKVVEIRHTGLSQDEAGTGSGVWFEPSGDANALTLANSPGTSGVNAGTGSSTTTSTRHDWFLALTASPDSIGSKTAFGLYTSLEYL